MSNNYIKATLKLLFIAASADVTWYVLLHKTGSATSVVLFLGATAYVIFVVSFGHTGWDKPDYYLRKFNKWQWYDDAPFFPTDPYEPSLSKAVKDSLTSFWPTKEKFKRSWSTDVVLVGLLIFLVLALLVAK